MKPGLITRAADVVEASEVGFVGYRSEDDAERFAAEVEEIVSAVQGG